MVRALAFLAFALAIVLAGCTAPANQPVEPTSTGGSGGASGSGNGTAPGNTTAPTGGAGGNGTGPLVELAVSTAGQYPLNPGFSPATLDVAAGSTVHVTFTNAEGLPLFGHNWVLEGVSGAETDVIDPGASAEATFPAPSPGTYAYYCSVGDHRAAGMEGTLTVA